MAKPLSRLLSPQRIKANAKHAQNAAYNAAQVAAQQAPPTPIATAAPQPAPAPTPMDPGIQDTINQFPAQSNPASAWNPAPVQPTTRPTQSIFGAAGEPRPSANNQGQFRHAPGIYRNTPPPQQNSVQRPTFSRGGQPTSLWGGAGSMGPQNQQWRKR